MIDNRLHLLELIRYLGKAGAEQTLLGGEDFQIGGSTEYS